MHIKEVGCAGGGEGCGVDLTLKMLSLQGGIREERKASTFEMLLGGPPGYQGHVVAQLVQARRYKSEGRGYDSRCCHWNFFSYIILPAAFGAWLCMVLKLGRSGQQIRNAWKVLKCGAGEGWRRSVGPIM